MLDKRNFYINGKWTAPIKSNDFQVINPSNEEPCAIVSLGGVADVNSAVKAAKEAFSSWSQTSKDEKISLIQKLYEIYKSRWSEMAESISLEMGAPIDWASTAQTSSGASQLRLTIPFDTKAPRPTSMPGDRLSKEYPDDGSLSKLPSLVFFNLYIGILFPTSF